MGRIGDVAGGGPSEGRRRLVAVMFTDVKGFSSLMESDEATAIGLVKAQREIVRRNIARWGGEERETIGDAFLVLFESAVNAVRAAIDIQREIWEGSRLANCRNISAKVANQFPIVQLFY